MTFAVSENNTLHALFVRDNGTDGYDKFLEMASTECRSGRLWKCVRTISLLGQLPAHAAITRDYAGQGRKRSGMVRIWSMIKAKCLIDLSGAACNEMAFECVGRLGIQYGGFRWARGTWALVGPGKMAGS